MSVLRVGEGALEAGDVPFFGVGGEGGVEEDGGAEVGELGGCAEGGGGDVCSCH